MTNSGYRSIAILGTTARAVVGAILIGLPIAWKGIGWWDVVGALIILPAIGLAATLVVNAAMSGSAVKRRGRVPWSTTQIGAAGVVIVTVICLGTVLTFVTPVDGVSIPAYFGVSMLLASLLGYEGCEVLALPNLLLGRRDAIWCPLYSALDHAEDVPGAVSKVRGSST